MALEGTPKSITLTEVERTWRVTLFCDVATPVAEWQIVANRGRILRDFQGNMFGREENIGEVQRAFGVIAAQAVPGGRRMITTYADLMQLIADAVDAFRQEDLTPPPAPEGE